MTSPPTEPTPQTTDNLDELFSTDPLKLSDDDIERIVKELRAKRLLWAVQEKEKQDKPKKASGKTAKKPSTQGDLDLSDLEIEL